MKRARIIYNPTAGREQFKRNVSTVIKRFEAAGYETSAHATTGEGDATEAARYAVHQAFDLVIVAGGDGTINEVIKGIAPEEKRPKLGIIPAGTTNDFARALHIPRDPLKAVDIILNEQTMFLDVGSVNEEYFINIAGGGELTELTYDVPIKLKTILGYFAYFVRGIEKLPSMKPVRTKIEYDGQVIDEEIMLFLITNTNSVGGFEKLAPAAKINDGFFDLIILRKTSLAEFIKLATLLLRGSHIDDERIIYAQAKRINVTPADRMLLNIDGEYGGLLPGEFINLKQHIEFFVPEKFISLQKGH